MRGIDELLEGIAVATAGIKELNLTRHDVTTSLIPDISQYRLGEEIIIEIFLYSDPERRTVAVKANLAHAIVKEFAKLTISSCQAGYMVECRKIEVYVATESSNEDTVCCIFELKENGYLEDMNARRPIINIS